MAGKYRRFNYAKPSFIEGMARIFDFTGALDYYPGLSARRKSSPEADAEAIRAAWETVGQCMWDAMGQFEELERDNLDAARKAQCQNQTK